MGPPPVMQMAQRVHWAGRTPYRQRVLPMDPLIQTDPAAPQAWGQVTPAAT